MNSAEKEGLHEKLVCDGMKSEKVDAGVKLVCDCMKSEKAEDGVYSDSGEKKPRLGRIQVSFYRLCMILLVPMSVFSLCLGVMVAAGERKYDGFFLAMMMCFCLTSELGGTLLCETVSSLNCSKWPDLIDFGGTVACGLTTCGYYYAARLCSFFEGTPGRRFAGATHMMMYGAYVFTIVSAVLTLGFLLLVCHQLIVIYGNYPSGAGAGAVAVAGNRVTQRGRGTLASDMYRFLIITITCAIFALEDYS